MAKAKKVLTENTEIPTEVKSQEGVTNPVSIPDIPAQMEETITEKVEEADETLIETVPEEINTDSEKVEVPVIVDSIPEQPKGETEVQFLQRILNKQHEGGFGRHLDDMINERIKELNNGK